MAEKRPTPQNWLVNVFAVPAGLAVLASFSEKLNFGPIVERVILNYEKVSIAIWSYVAYIINIPLEPLHGILTFYVVLISVCARSVLISSNTDSTINHYIGESFSQSLILFFLTNSPEDGILGSIFFISVFFGIFFLSSYFRRYDYYPLAAVLAILGVILLSILLILCAPDSYSPQLNPSSSPLWSGVAIVVGLANRSIGVSRMFFTRVLVFVLMVFCADFVGTRVLPWIDGLLTSVGA